MYIQSLLHSLGGEKVSTNETELFRHSHDESSHSTCEPDVVCFPENRDDVLAILEVARNYQIPVTPFGAGSGLEGQAIPIQRGISINFERMNQLVKFSPENLTVTVQPGITRLQLNELVNRHGLFFPLDPGADASIGGMVATNASGTTAVRYGSMRDQILDLEVVLVDGTVIHTGTHAKKSSSGYHLTGLFTGSEGTLGIITEITLRLHGIPEHTIAASCTFPTVDMCARAAQTILLSDIPVMRMELVDATSIRQVNAYGDYHYPVAHTAFFEFSGTRAAVEEEVLLAKELLVDLGCENWKVASNSNERAQIWKARHELSHAFRHISGMAALGTDVCVPIAYLPELVKYARELVDHAGMLAGVFGHMGDGNFHTVIVYNPLIPEEKEKAENINEKLVLKAIRVGGTCTGEHGVGIGKMKFQEAEHGAAVPIMKRIKKLFDPENLLNPGKIFKEIEEKV